MRQNIAPHVDNLSGVARMKSFLIVNPEAAGGRTRHRWPRLADKIYDRIGLFEHAFTNAAGAASLLATDAVKAGYERIVAVGGDGTVNEVLNGLFDDDGALLNPDITLGCLPLGSGTDFWKSFGVSDHFDAALARLGEGAKGMRCDIGAVALGTHDGHPLQRYFCNVADVGLGGMVVDRAKKLPRWSNGFVNYGIAAVTSALQWDAVPMTISVDDTTMVTDDRLTVALIANGQYCGGGMWVAPEARLDSGLLEVVTIPALGFQGVMRVLPGVYRGRLAQCDGIQTYRGTKITITTAAPLHVTLDGELPGRTPATFRIHPRLLHIVA
jgi:diacylglycerol kinase (ATP)